MNAKLNGLLVAAALLAASSAQALSISLTPASRDVSPGQATTFDLVMDFEAQSLGGGIIFDFSGPISFTGFTPSAYFNSLNTAADDTDFTGFGTTTKPASAEFELHLGNFAGISGQNVLGQLAFTTTGSGTGIIDLSISPDNFYGGFFDFQGNEQTVALGDAQINANAIPLPATAWLFLAGIGAAATRLRRRAR